MVKRLIKFPRGDFTFYEAEPRRETWLIAAGGVILSMHSKTEGRWLMILPQQLICYRNCLLLTLLDNMSAVSSLSASAYRKHQLLSRTRLSYRLLRPISVVRGKWFGPPLQSMNWVGIIVVDLARRKEIHEKCLLIGSLAEMEIFRETPVVFVRRRDNGAIRIPRRCVSGIHSSLPLFKTAQLHARCNMMQGKKRRDMERERKKRIIRYSLILNRLWQKM